MKLKYRTTSPVKTKKMGEGLAKILLKMPKRKKAIVLALEGDLGGGKTTFLQGLAQGLGVREKILSPTFIILRRFKIPGQKSKNFYHIDCYRIKGPKDILDLNFREIIADPRNVVAIEWADKIKNIVPQNSAWIKFRFISKNIRKITISASRY